jgi:hypothetical protein
MTRRAVIGMPGASLERSRAWLVLAAATALLAFVAPRADAATASSSYGYLATFGDTDTSATTGQHNSVSVEASTHNILVVENGADRIQVFAADATAGGTPLATIDLGGFAVLGPVAVAADPSSGAIYVADSFAVFFGGSGVAKFVSDGAPIPTYTLDPGWNAPPALLGAPAGLAVDPVTHDVLVSDSFARQVYRLSSSGTVLSTFDGSDTSEGQFLAPTSLAVSPAGSTYVVDPQLRRVEKFSPAGTTQGAVQLSEGAVPIDVAVNPQNGDVAVVETLQGLKVIEGFTSAGQPKFSTRFPSSVSGLRTIGLSIDGVSDRIYAAASDGSVQTFVVATQPGVDPPAVSQISGVGAHVRGDVDPGGVTTMARFEYCLASADCANHPTSDPNDPTNASSNPWTRGPDHANLSGSGSQTIEDDLSGLNPNATYLVRVYASNALTDNTSASTSFTTAVVAPTVQTGPAADVTDSGAQLTGTIDTIGAQTTFHFDYGLTTSYGSTAPVGAEAVAGNSRTPRTFSRTIGALLPGTTYHYRLVARNSAGEAVGADRTFTTLIGNQVAPHRAYEQVSPVDKKGASINTVFGFQAATDGSAIEMASTATPSDGSSAPQVSRFMSRRGSTDWLRWQQLDPPLGVVREIVSSVTLAVSSDFTHALVASNRALVNGAVENSGNLYVVDLRTGEYSLVAASTQPGAFLAMVSPRATNMYLAGAPDFSWVVFVSRVSLLPNVSGTAMYKWSKGTGLGLESHLPDGSVPTGNVWFQDASVLSTREVSDDGNTMYFSLTSGEQGVYRRASGQTTAISVSQVAGDPTTPQPGQIDGISRDGRYAIFHSTRLTTDAPSGSDNLYQYDAQDGSLTYIGSLYAGALPFNVLGVSDDAQTVYFNDGPNTVVWREGTLHTVTSYHPDNTQGLNAYFSPNGDFMAYLAGDGNAHLYDATADEDTCISCPADGTAGGHVRLTEPDRNISNRVPQVVTDGGQAFFDSPSRLVSADHNGSRDVYAYRDGRLTLISPGDGPFDARFADASADGSNVFFTTAEPLVGQDVDEATDVYDARVGGGFPGQTPPPPPAPCAKADCAEPGPGPVTSAPVGSPPQPPGPAPKRTNQERVQLALVKTTFTSASVHISFRASQRGRVRVTGSRVSTSVRNVTKAGTYTIVVPLSKKARSLRHAHRKVKVSVKVTLSGGWGSASAKYSRTIGK